MTIQELREQLNARRAAAYYGRRYHYQTPSGGVQLGVMQGLGGAWMVGYLKESGSRCRLKSKALPVIDDAGLLQEIFQEWAEKKGLQEVAA